MTKIAFIINSVHLGGPGNVLRTMLHNLDLSKFEITLIILFEKRNDEPVIKEFKNMGIKVIMLNFDNKIDFIINSRKRMNKILKEQPFDIIHSHGVIPDFILSRIKYKCQKISTLHCVVYDYPRIYGRLKSTFLIPFHLGCLKKLDTVVCCSKSVFDATKCLENSTYIRNGIDGIKSSKTLSKQDIGLPQDSIVYIYAGQLRSGKNIVWLTEQFKNHHKENEYLLVFGRGDQLEECKQNADEHIKIFGFTQDLPVYLKISDIYISASKSEGFSISLLEALERGLGVFVSDIPSHKEVFEIDNTYIGETFNAENFEKQWDILRNNFDKINHENIAEFQKKHLSAKNMTEQYINIYNRTS